jgi:hypothetical protein
MKSFMTMGSLARGLEVNEAPVEGDVTPFPTEDAVMTIFGRHPSLGKHHMLDPSVGTPTRGGQGWGGVQICKAPNFLVH